MRADRQLDLGGIAFHPAYDGPSDIEDQALVPTLAQLNRAGFMTIGSQAGESGPGYDRVRWEQRAAVEGFADSFLAFRLARAAECRPGLRPPQPGTLPRWRYRYEHAVAVTRRDGYGYTYFGAQIPGRHIRSWRIGFSLCHPDAVRALCAAWQVTLIDPEWGRPDLLWSVLQRGAGAEAAPADRDRQG